MAKVSGNDAPKVPGRVQGLNADIEDLVLRSTGGSLKKEVEPEDVALEVGPAIRPAPMLTRTIDGASSISLEVFDPDRTFLRNSLLAKKWEAEIDGLGFRYIGLDKQGQNLTLTLEDEWAARLKEHFGPKEVLRKNSTRARFIKRLVEEACPGLDFYCPQLKVKQPIGSKAEKKKSKTERAEAKKEDRGKGIGDSYKHLKVKGLKATTTQRELAELALEIADQGNAPFVCRVAVIAALIDETNMGSVDSNNVLEGEGSGEGAPIGSAEDEISGFLFGKPTWTGTTAVGYHKAHPHATYYEIAQAVQASGAGAASNGRDNYGQFGTEAKEWVEAYDGGEGVSGSITVIEPYRFEVEGVEEGKRNGKPENYWEAIKRLAKEVNWRFFISANRAYFMPETELIKSMVRLAIDEDTPGVEFAEIGFSYNEHGDVTEVTIPAFVEVWKPPPGSVVTLADMGPVSLGSGDAPSEKGVKVGLSSAIKASTHEGRGRFLVSKIEVPLIGDPAQRLATITLKTPSRPLPEQEAKKKSLSVGSVGGVEGNKTLERMLQAADAKAALKQEYVWGGGHASFDSPTGYDCSGGVSWLLHVGGLLDSPLDTQGLAAWGEAGPGRWITVYVKTTGSAEEEHTAIEVAGELYESGGGPENTNPNGGWGKVDSSKATEFLKQFDTKRHPKGF